MKIYMWFSWVVIFMFALIGKASASTLYVDVNSSNPIAPFSSWGTASTNIQSSINAAVDGDTVSVTNGYYLLSSEITVTNNITIQSVNGPEITIVDGGGTNRCFNLGGSASLLTGFTITNGYSAANGGGVYCDNTLPVVSNCVFSGNSARGGGGMRFGTANNCVFVGNFSTGGGGMYDGVANLCLFSSNSVAYYDGDIGSGNGGGMHSGIANFCQFIGNSADSDINFLVGNGGGLFNGQANHCEFIGNSAVAGGGMYNLGNGIASTASNCTFIGNSATQRGGGAGGKNSPNMTLFNCVLSGNKAASGGGVNTATANNCTITGNSANFGGGMVVNNSGGSVNNCIVWGNLAGEGSDLRFSGDVSIGLVANHTCSSDVEHGVDGNITNAPMLVSASHISTNSPCRGAGSSAYAMGTDIDGEAWLNPPSMGCDEIAGAVIGPIDLSIMGPLKIADGFAGKYLADIRGAVTGNLLNFGDGSLITNAVLAIHTWDAPGVYTMVLSAFNEDYPAGVSITQMVHVVSAEATSVYVSETMGNDANDGSDWAAAKKSIQSGVDVQGLLGGIVWVSNGTYAVTAEITVTNDIRIQSINGQSVTIVDGGGSNRCFKFESSAHLLSGFTITNGYSSGEGGGIYCANINTVVSNCTISGNKADGGGGGMYLGTANHCVLSENSGSLGGGMSLGIANTCSIISNIASRNGGGLHYAQANNCFIHGNFASQDGGGMSYGTANNCTVTANSAVNFGGGCSAYDSPSGYQGGTMNNSIVWGNSAGGYNNSYGFLANSSCSSDIPEGENGSITNNPLFVDAANNDYRLLSNSPCINWGNNADVSDSIDRDGNPRVVEGYVDMGCYEYQGLIGEADNDMDGMSDAWERLWFGAHVSPDGNADGDGSSNGDEYVAGTDPTNSAFYFAITNYEASASFIVEWPSVAGRWYEVLWTPSLTNSFQSMTNFLEHPQNSYTDTVHDVELGGFYQINVRMK